MPRRRPPKAQIIEYKQLKTAAGGSGASGGGGGFRAGENLICKVIKDEPGGYEVLIVNHYLAGFLPTQALLRPGEEILGQFVCVHNHRILLSARFSNNSPKVQAHASVRWTEHLDEIDLASTEAPNVTPINELVNLNLSVPVIPADDQ